MRIKDVLLDQSEDTGTEFRKRSTSWVDIQPRQNQRLVFFKMRCFFKLAEVLNVNNAAHEALTPR